MLKKLLFAIIIMGTSSAMKNKITNIALNPERDPLLFFETIEERIASEVTKAQQACNECNSASMNEHLANVASLLSKAQVNQRYLADAFPTQKAQPVNAKRKAQFNQDIQKSYWLTQQFREQTNILIQSLQETKNDPITDQEWYVMQEIFKCSIPENLLKRSKFSGE